MVGAERKVSNLHTSTLWEIIDPICKPVRWAFSAWWEKLPNSSISIQGIKFIQLLVFFVSPSKDVDHTIHCCHCHTNSRGRRVATSLHDRPCSRVEIKNMHFIVQWYSGFKFTPEYICLGSDHGHSMWASGLWCAIRLGHLPTSILIRFKLQK